MRLLMAAVLLLGLCGVTEARQVARRIAPWCAVYSVGWGDVVSYCQYWSFEQCRPHVIAGWRGFCNINPAWPGTWQEAMHPELLRKHKARRR